jgi:hypothetical protein
MAFPGTYDIRYYKGDTFEFFIYPKNASGNTFDLSGFNTINFTIAEVAGAAGATNALSGEVDTDGNNTYIKCIITPEVGEQLDATKTYVYDVQIEKAAGNGVDYPYIYTILKGNISITEEVTLPAQVVVTIPDEVTGLAVTENPAGTVVVDWTAATTGDTATSYKIYGKSADTPIPVTTYQLITTVTAPTTIYSATSAFGVAISAIQGSTLDIKVTAVNSAGENTGVEDSVTILAKPGAVTSFNLIEDPSNSGAIAGSWTAPATGDPATAYNIYVKYLGGAYTLAVEDYPLTYFTTHGTALQAAIVSGVEYTFKITSKNAAGENTTSFAEDAVTV